MKGRLFFGELDEDFHTKGTFYHLTTGAKQLPGFALLFANCAKCAEKIDLAQ